MRLDGNGTACAFAALPEGAGPRGAQRPRVGVSAPRAPSAGRSSRHQACALVGAVEVRHGDGTYVRAPHAGITGLEDSALDVAPRELIEARRTLEPVLASLAATRVDTDLLRRLTRNVDEATEIVAEPAQLPRFMQLGLAFHADLALGCGNSLLADIVGQFVNAETHPLWLLVNQHAVSSTAAREGQLRQHREVLAAIASGDAAQAEYAMAVHLTSVDAVIFHPATTDAAQRGGI